MLSIVLYLNEMLEATHTLGDTNKKVDDEEAEANPEIETKYR